jgi:hypothetical protein
MRLISEDPKYDGYLNSLFLQPLDVLLYMEMAEPVDFTDSFYDDLVSETQACVLRYWEREDFLRRENAPE